MEREKRNQTASFLMVVGIIFIVVAGTIFVSTAWQYLSATEKQGILFLAAILLFLGADRMARGGRMKKTEAALYYLGTSCLGLFALSVCGEIMMPDRAAGDFYEEIGWMTEAILIAGIVMLLPVVLRFIIKRTAFDFIMMALLADWVLFWFRLAGGYGWLGGCVISAVGLTAYVLADYLRERWIGESERLELAFLVLYILHGVNFIVHNLTLLCIDDALTFRFSLFLMALFMIGITLLMQLTWRSGILRIFNSMAIYWSILTGVKLVHEMTVTHSLCMWSGEMQHFVAFCLCALCMVIMARKEMVCMTGVWGGLLPFAQIMIYGDYYFLFSHMKHQVSPYVPFSGVLVLAMGFLIFRKSRDGRLDREQTTRYVWAVALQGIVMLVLFCASKCPFYEKGIYSILTLQCLTVAFCFRNKIAQRCFQTGALFFGEILILIYSYDILPVEYEVERGCFLAAAGIFAIGVIWKQQGPVMRTFRFICMCLLMTIMLGNAFLEGAVGNALILGVTGVGMLSCAAFCNSRRYAVLASTVLILLAGYLTRSFWCSIEWWVYLFVAGVILVVLAIRKEKGNSISDL